MHEDTIGCRNEELRRDRSTRPEDVDVGVGASWIEVILLESLIEVPAGLDMAETGKYIAYGPNQFCLIDGRLRVVDYCIQKPEKIGSRTGGRLATDRHHR